MVDRCPVWRDGDGRKGALQQAQEKERSKGCGGTEMARGQGKTGAGNP
ncbi:MAG: hypothetical protein IKH10_03075 [Bacteroidetes bacterium]|nr:hypothetical protein [Bacteroidota bacterium]